jgi:hypothetical protein
MPDLLSLSTWRNMYSRAGRGCGWIIAIVFGIPMALTFGMNQFRQFSGHGGAGNEDIVAKVNGEPISSSQFHTALQAVDRRDSGTAGEPQALAQGNVLIALVQRQEEKEIADQLKVHVSDAEIDQKLEEIKQKVLSSNTDWNDFLAQRQLSESDFRDDLAIDLVPEALERYFENRVTITDAQAQAQYDEVKLDIVTIPAVNPNPVFGRPTTGALPDADASKRADNLLAKVKAGADIQAIARANSSDPSAKSGGLLDWQPVNPQMRSQLAMYGKAFMDAVAATPKDQLTGVIKLGAFSPGYAFAKVVDRRQELPKDFNLRNEIRKLQAQKAGEMLQARVTELDAKARIEVTDPDIRAYYDLTRLRNAEHAAIYAQFGQGNVPGAMSPDDVTKLKATVDKEITDLYKRHPDDATNALLYKDVLREQGAANMQKPEMQDLIIKLDDTALRSTENRQLRFELADLYRQRHKIDLAKAQYKKLTDQLNYRLSSAPGAYDLNTLREDRETRQQLVARYRSIDMMPEAQKEEQAVAQLNKQIAVEEQKQADEQKKAAAGAEAARRVGGTLTMPAPGGAPAPIGSAPAPGGATAPAGAKPPAPNGAAAPAGSAPATGKPSAPSSSSAPPSGGR